MKGNNYLFDHYKGITRVLSEYSSILNRFNNENYNRLIDSVSRNLSLSDTLGGRIDFDLMSNIIFDWTKKWI